MNQMEVLLKALVSCVLKYHTLMYHTMSTTDFQSVALSTKQASGMGSKVLTYCPDSSLQCDRVVWDTVKVEKWAASNHDCPSGLQGVKHMRLKHPDAGAGPVASMKAASNKLRNRPSQPTRESNAHARQCCDIDIRHGHACPSMATTIADGMVCQNASLDV